MCGRYTLTNPDPKRLALRFGVVGDVEFDERPRFNIAPTDSVLAVREADQGRREIGRLRWGLIPGRWALERKGRPLINARAETLDEQPAYRDSFERRRCLIPADGFYEWQATPAGKRPIWISKPDQELFAFAGIWAAIERGDERILSCSIVTCEPNDLVRPIHDRMPVLLSESAEGRWLDPSAEPNRLLDLLKPYPSRDLVTREVGESVNDVHEDGPHLLEPPARLF